MYQLQLRGILRDAAGAVEWRGPWRLVDAAFATPDEAHEVGKGLLPDNEYQVALVLTDTDHASLPVDKPGGMT